MQRTIVRSVFITLGSLIGFVGLLALLLGIFSPITMAKIFDGVNGNISLYFYKSNYEKTKNINDLYLVVNKSIQFKNDLSIVECFPILLREPRYDEFMDFLNENSTKEGTMLQKVMLSNEDNRLKSRYVRALVSINMLDEAFRFAVTDLSDPDNFVISSLVEFVGENTLEADNYDSIYLRLDAFEQSYNAAVTDFERAKMSRKAYEAAQFLVVVYDYIDALGFVAKAQIEAKRDSFSVIFNTLIS
ncbi:MAG: hypothetical protein LBN07_03635 [Christensenellaceae bacterium]|jgi:hypothetical protein|nr:hypothetical protein [Christensenellaceae bacterium]